MSQRALFSALQSNTQGSTIVLGVADAAQQRKELS